MAKKRRGQAFIPAPKVLTSPLGAITAKRALRRGKQDEAPQLAKDGASKEEIKESIWNLAMTPDKRALLRNKLKSGYADLDGAIDDLADNLIAKHRPKKPHNDDLITDDES